MLSLIIRQVRVSWVDLAWCLRQADSYTATTLALTSFFTIQGCPTHAHVTSTQPIRELGWCRTAGTVQWEAVSVVMLCLRVSECQLLPAGWWWPGMWCTLVTLAPLDICRIQQADIYIMGSLFASWKFSRYPVLQCVFIYDIIFISTLLGHSDKAESVHIGVFSSSEMINDFVVHGEHL